MEENQNQGENNIHVFGASSGSKPESTTTSGPRMFGAASSPKSEDEAKYGPGASTTSSGPKPEGGTTSGPRTFGSSQEGGTTSGPRTFGSSQEGGTSSGPRVFGAGSEGGQEKPRASRRIVIGDVEGPGTDYGYQSPKSFGEMFDAFLSFLTKPFDFLFDFLERSNYEEQTKKVLGYMEKSTPIIIIISGIGFFIYLIVQMIKDGMPFGFGRGDITSLLRGDWVSYLLGMNVFSITLTLLVLIITLAVLAPKALRLARSTQDKNAVILIRPEYLYILKVIIVVLNVLAFLSPPYFLGLILLPVTVILLGILCKPQLIGIRAEYPGNAVVEITALILLYYRIVMFLLSPVIVILSFLFLLGAMFANTPGLYPVAMLLPVVAPVVAYFVYLFTVFLAEFVQAICSIPTKIDKVHETLLAQKQQSEESEEQQA